MANSLHCNQFKMPASYNTQYDVIIYTQGPKPVLINSSAFPRSLFALSTHLFTIIAIGRILSCLYIIHYVYKYCPLDASIEKP